MNKIKGKNFRVIVGNENFHSPQQAIPTEFVERTSVRLLSEIQPKSL